MNISWFTEIQSRLSEVFGDTNIKKDIGNNAHALADYFFKKIDLVTREEFEIQTRLIENMQKKIDFLERKLDGEETD